MSTESASEHCPPWEHPNCADPIHDWFGLGRANYLVIPRTLLQSFSRETQLAICRALEMGAQEEQAHTEHPWPHEANIVVKLKCAATGRYIKDPLANYERGRRKLWKCIEGPASASNEALAHAAEVKEQA